MYGCPGWYCSAVPTVKVVVVVVVVCGHSEEEERK